MEQEENKRLLILGIFGGFVALSLLLSALTGTNPIESLFMMVGQIAMYLLLLAFFGTPIFLLAALFTISWRDMKNSKGDPEE